MYMMQNITEKGISLVFRASQGRGLLKLFRGQAPGPPFLFPTLALCPLPKSRDLATPLPTSGCNPEVKPKKTSETQSETLIETLKLNPKQKRQSETLEFTLGFKHWDFTFELHFGASLCHLGVLNTEFQLLTLV